MNRATVALITLLVPVAGSAWQFPGERASDRYEERQVRRGLGDDRQDLLRMERLLARYDEAVARRSRRALFGVEDDVLRTLDREVREARLELTISARDCAPGDRCYGHCERNEVRDVRRDLVRLHAIRSEFGSLLGRVDRPSIERKRALLGELVQIARLEPREDRMHLREAWNRVG